jgi:hypothetical protein
MVVTNVTTGAELQQAILDDKPNILIRNHLDLTNLSLVDDWRVLGTIPSAKTYLEGENFQWVMNIRVRHAHIHRLN